MDDFKDIDFDTIQGVTEEVRSLTSRLAGILDYLRDDELNSLPETAQEQINHLVVAVQKADEELHTGLESWLNAIWHEHYEDEKAQAIQELLETPEE